jgi:hypothetical protein
MDFNVSPVANASYMLYAKTAEGCVASATNAAVVTVYPIPDAPTMGGEGNSYCTSGTITATFGNGGTGIRWTDDNTAASPRTVSASGIYYAVTTSDEGCESSAVSVSVTIVPPGGQGQQNTCGCATGLNICNGLCTAYGCNAPTICGGFTEVSTLQYDGSGLLTWTNARNACWAKGEGWRMPDGNEASCLCYHKATLPGGYVGANYWSSHPGNIGNYQVQAFHKDNCLGGYLMPDNQAYVKCVR